MSDLRLTRGQRIVGKMGAAAVIAVMAGVPSQLTHLLVGGQDRSGMALAGKPVKPPPPPTSS